MTLSKLLISVWVGLLFVPGRKKTEPPIQATLISSIKLLFSPELFHKSSFQLSNVYIVCIYWLYYLKKITQRLQAMTIGATHRDQIGDVGCVSVKQYST